LNTGTVDQSIVANRAKTAERFDVHPDQMPRHVAIIMDGNGRWAVQRGMQRYEGHRQGGRIVERVVLHGVNLGLECLTLYAFSAQNWKRPRKEINFLMQLYTRYLASIRATLKKHNVRLIHLGNFEQLPKKVAKELSKTMEQSADNTGMVLGMALNYGSREEIAFAAQKIAQEYKDEKISLDQINPDYISSHLDTATLPDPDLLIRTSNEMRISNFLLWQISYAEFYVTETLWPDFSQKDLDEAVIVYAGRNRRMGDVEEKK
jgi:undecaprenyl diphosphate synthase